TAFNEDYKHKAETATGEVTFTFHPLTPIEGCAYSLIYIREGTTGGYAGYAMTAIGPDFVYTKTIANTTPISYYFTYQVPSGGERNSSDHPHAYTVGATCTIATGIPTVSVVTPLANASYTEPATVSITTNTNDTDGTVSKVEFYSGNTLLGTDLNTPFSFDWLNAPAGNYNIAAKVTDNNGLSTYSKLVKIVVAINNSAGFCGTDVTGDYSYRIETVGGNVVFTFHPLTPIAGSAYAFIYVREGLTGPYPGYAMTAIGSDFRFTKAIANATPLSVYFTYQVPSGGEHTSLDAPHSYTVGASCAVPIPVTLLNFNATQQTNGSVALNWSTAMELNNDYFRIEKSADGRNYSMLTTVDARANTVGVTAYNTVDRTPGLGYQYYRLSQVDLDQRITIHAVRVIRIKQRAAGITVYPNPISTAASEVKINLSASNATALTIVLLDNVGRVIQQQKCTPQSATITFPIDVQLVPGMYWLKVEGEAPIKLMVYTL
ncbi:MAG: Ig-like domain-containing protein, partial [Paludibacter sp.]